MAKHRKPNISIQEEYGGFDLLVEVFDFRGTITVTDQKITVRREFDKSALLDEYRDVVNCIYSGPDRKWRLMRQKSRGAHSYVFELELPKEE